MASCGHLGWLYARSTSGTEVTLFDPGRTARVVEELQNPQVQQPSTILFIGRKAKKAALEELFLENNVTKGQHDGIATLRLDNSSRYSNYPTFFAESDPFTPNIVAGAHTCHEDQPLRVTWDQSTPIAQMSDIFHARLLFLFTDVLCIFADDFISFENVVDRLKKWATAGSGSNSSKKIRPRVVIVKRGDKASPSPTYDFLNMHDIRLSLDQESLKTFYSSIIVLHLADEQISPLARFRRLKELLWRNLDEMREVRQQSGYLYSAAHFEELFRLACKHTAASRLQPFNFVRASRHCNEVFPDHTEHLTTFLRFGTQLKVSRNAMLDYISSSIILDAYPPRMHKFQPKTVYDNIYRRSCLGSLINLHRHYNTSEVENQIEDDERYMKNKLALYFLKMASTGKTAAELHLETASSLGIPWHDLKCNATCLWCLRRNPENPLSCEHSICDTCVRVYGREQTVLDYLYEINCILCRIGSLSVKIKPVTAGERILSIDGGGPRGVIPLEFLATIQEIMGPGTLVQELFDVAFGTSVGGLIVCMLFLRGVPISQCVQLFDKLVLRLFNPFPGPRNILKRFRLLLRGWYMDGHYDINTLEACLKDNLGSGRMFGYQQGVLSTKVGVVAATIGKADPVIFTNYNGVHMRSRDCGYVHIRPKDFEDEPLLWEAGRGTSAAPVLYQPTLIKAAGLVQDGGMSGHNNPVNLALWEIQHIEPSVKKPDIVLSLGTGSEKAPTSSIATEFRHVFLDGYISRLWRSYMSSFNGQNIWEKLMNHVDKDDKKYYMRLNTFRPKGLPALDNTECMEELREEVRLPENIRACRETLYALLVSTFFFELCAPPKFLRECRYHCRGTIRSRLSGDATVRLLQLFCGSSLAFTTDLRTLGYYGGLKDLCCSCRRYQKAVELDVRHPEDSFSIYLQSVTQGKRRISAFPQTMQWFVCQQQLATSFGTDHHDQPRSCGTCYKAPNLKRKIELVESPSNKKSRHDNFLI